MNHFEFGYIYSWLRLAEVDSSWLRLTQDDWFNQLWEIFELTERIQLTEEIDWLSETELTERNKGINLEK